MGNSLTRRITWVLFGTLICFVSQPLAAAEPATQACQGEFVVQLSSHPVDTDLFCFPASGSGRACNASLPRRICCAVVQSSGGQRKRFR